jgi:hypothetical protein
MTDTPINLNKIRKEKTRSEDKARADANAIRFGLTKAQRLLNASREDQNRSRLDMQKFDEE